MPPYNQRGELSNPARYRPPMNPKRTRSLVSLVAALFLLGGCAGKSSPPAVSEIWQGTKNTVSTAYEATKNTITTTYNSITNKKPEEPKPDNTKNAVSFGSGTNAGTEGKTTSSRGPSYDADIRTGNIKPITDPQVRGSGPKELHVIPRASLTTAGLRRQMAKVDKDLENEKNPRRRTLLTNRRRQLAEALRTSQMEEEIVREIGKLRGRLRALQEKLRKIRAVQPGVKS